ncbi:hypothetical protein TNCV_925321 [Trichonephila clavipes]|nr:hypothetical protein TNCV_925321 [Trichonephila clavipes]
MRLRLSHIQNIIKNHRVLNENASQLHVFERVMMMRMTFKWAGVKHQDRYSFRWLKKFYLLCKIWKFSLTVTYFETDDKQSDEENDRWQRGFQLPLMRSSFLIWDFDLLWGEILPPNVNTI